jgi:hypothetical protein
MAKKLNSMRLLDREGIAYEVLRFPDTIHSARVLRLTSALPRRRSIKRSSCSP